MEQSTMPQAVPKEKEQGQRLYTPQEVQEKLDRVAQKERERGRRMERRQEKAAPAAEAMPAGAPEGKEEGGRVQEQAGGVSQEGMDAFLETASAKLLEQEAASALSSYEEELLGQAVAMDCLKQGEEATETLLGTLLSQKQRGPKEEACIFTLFCELAKQEGAKQLSARGLDGEAVIKDPAFIAFAELMRGDVPLMQVYDQYQKTQPKRAKPKSTGSVHGQEGQSAAYFTKEQVGRMTRGQIREHFKQIEASRRYWK